MRLMARARARIFGVPLTACRMNLLERMPKGSVCAEIGVYKGEFSAYILKVVRPKKLHLIDPWHYEMDPAYDRTWYGGRVGVNQSYMDTMYESVMRKFQKEIDAGVVVLHRGSSSDVLQTFPPDYFDWVYIDGNHSYDFVKSDIDLSLRAVKENGYIAGDDYHENGWWGDGVIRAVDEARNTCATQMVLDGQFILQKRSPRAETAAVESDWSKRVTTQRIYE